VFSGPPECDKQVKTLFLIMYRWHVLPVWSQQLSSAWTTWQPFTSSTGGRIRMMCH